MRSDAVGEVHTERRFERRPALDATAAMLTTALRRREPRDEALDRVRDGAHLDEVVVVDAKTDRPFAELGLDGFEQVEQRVVVGVEVFAQARVERDRVDVDARGSRRAARARSARPSSRSSGARWLCVSAGTVVASAHRLGEPRRRRSAAARSRARRGPR